MGDESDSSEELDVERNEEEEEEEEEVMIYILWSFDRFSVRATLESTVASFKALLAQKCELPADQQRLIYKGRVLREDEKTLGNYGLQAGHTVDMAHDSNLASSTPAADSNEGGGSGNLGVRAPLSSGLYSPGGNRASGVSDAAGLQGFEQAQQTQNAVVRALQKIITIQGPTDNPNLFRRLIMNTPWIREFIDRNPDVVAHVLNYSSTHHQTREGARSPELMQEMMRIRDRKMRNIESTPGGFDELRRMHEYFQEPLLSATRMGNSKDNLVTSSLYALLRNHSGEPRDRNISSTTGADIIRGPSASPNSNPLPNPWSNSSARGGTRPKGAVRKNSRAASPLGMCGTVEAALLYELLKDPSMSLQDPVVPRLIRNIRSIPGISQLPDVEHELALQAAHISQLNRSQSTQDSAQPFAAAGSPNDAEVEMLTNKLGGLEVGSSSDTNQPNVPLEELYATQLAELREMGFLDTQANIEALRATGGNVQEAVKRLKGNNGPLISDTSM